MDHFNRLISTEIYNSGVWFDANLERFDTHPMHASIDRTNGFDRKEREWISYQILELRTQ
ncbi:hypothetical protein HI914_03958 [Erysiphe necator]|nr:hypothetical protein HI914_03958 [Erysiphe necator]